MFVSVADNTKYKLYDFSISGNLGTAAKKKRNFIAFIKPGTAAFDSMKEFYYDNGTWRYHSPASGKQGEVVDDFEIPMNTAFMTSFNVSDGAVLNFAGQVQKGVGGLITTSAPAGATCFMVVNPTGRDVSLAEISISGSLSTAAKKKRNYIAFMKTGTAAFDSMKEFYYDNGTWRYHSPASGKQGEAVENPESFMVSANEGFMCSFNAADGAAINFPSPL